MFDKLFRVYGGMFGVYEVIFYFMIFVFVFSFLAQALAAASPTKVFKSHCAPEGPETKVAAKLTVAELRERLTALGLSPVGRKASRP
jgi:hypothetical protein